MRVGWRVGLVALLGGIVTAGLTYLLVARAARTVGSLATARPGCALASSVSRAASFTGSPITV